MKKLMSILLLIVVFSFCLSGCRNMYPYTGEYRELYTTAIYSIPDAKGYMHHGEGAYNSDIHIWEQDDYGRTLFSYCEDYGNSIFGLVISQGYDESNAYFYPDVNYALTLLDSERLYEGATDEHLMNRTKDFYLESKDELKKENDWNKPLDKSKCVSYPITDHKVLGDKVFSFNRTQCDEILNEYSETLNLISTESGPHRYNSVLQVDAEGKILHEIYGVHRNFDKPGGKNNGDFTFYGITLWVITDKDGNYDKENGVMVMYSKANDDAEFVYNARDILEFKNKNGWKNSYCVN